MDAAAWLAEFARRERDYLAWRDEQHSRVRGQVQIKVEPRPVVLEEGRDVDVGDDRVPSSAQRLVSRSQAAGWSTRMVGSLAAVPASGLVTVVTVRCRRHDERCWAAWHNGRFDVAWYRGPGGLERLGWMRLGRKPLKMRGVMDVIEGVRGPKQWIDLLERQEMDRAVQVLRDASLGPMIVT